MPAGFRALGILRHGCGLSVWRRPPMGPTAPDACLLGTDRASGSTRFLYEVGLSSAPESLGLSDGLKLYGVYISAVVRCAPPANKPLPDEIHTCRAYLLREWHALRPHLRVVLALGAMAHQAAVELLGFHHRPPFQHGALYESPTGVKLLSSYHPSQQNTFTGRLTWAMWQAVFAEAKALMG